MYHNNNQGLFLPIGIRPLASANVMGNAMYPSLSGVVSFFPYRTGTLVVAEFWNLPYDKAQCAGNVLGFHIHEGGTCEGDFVNAGGHYDPSNCPHPAHSGDLPPLFSNHGYSWQAFYTERFSVNEVIGKTVIVHSAYDDFESQPGGDAGNRIACGVVIARR